MYKEPQKVKEKGDKWSRAVAHIWAWTHAFLRLKFLVAIRSIRTPPVHYFLEVPIDFNGLSSKAAASDASICGDWACAHAPLAPGSVTANGRARRRTAAGGWLARLFFGKRPPAQHAPQWLIRPLPPFTHRQRHQARAKSHAAAAGHRGRGHHLEGQSVIQAAHVAQSSRPPQQQQPPPPRPLPHTRASTRLTRPHRPIPFPMLHRWPSHGTARTTSWSRSASTRPRRRRPSGRSRCVGGLFCLWYGIDRLMDRLVCRSVGRSMGRSEGAGR